MLIDLLESSKAIGLCPMGIIAMLYYCGMLYSITIVIVLAWFLLHQRYVIKVDP